MTCIITPLHLLPPPQCPKSVVRWGPLMHFRAPTFNTNKEFRNSTKHTNSNELRDSSGAMHHHTPSLTTTTPVFKISLPHPHTPTLSSHLMLQHNPFPPNTKTTTHTYTTRATYTSLHSLTTPISIFLPTISHIQSPT